MNEKDKYAPTGEAMKRIGNAVRYVETAGRLPDGGLKKRHRLIAHEEGILLDDLLGTDDPNVPTTARFQIKSPHRTGNGWSDDVAPSIVTVLNRTNVEFEAGTPGCAEELDTDKWYFYTNGGGLQVRDGVVISVDGCGMYTIELGTLGDAASGSGASGSCDACGTPTGAGTSACAIPTPGGSNRVTGDGVQVAAYDPASAVIPLVVGTDCVVARVSGASTAASGSGSGSDVVWRVVRGFQEHIVEYRERGECCDDGTYRVLGKTPIILIGVVCDEILCEECPASGSG